MIYLYLYALIFWVVIYIAYQKNKTKLPHKLTSSLRRNKVITFFTCLFITYLLIGSPVRIESTSLSGKQSFTPVNEPLTDRTEATDKPENEDFRKKGLLIEQNKKEKENAINKTPD